MKATLIVLLLLPAGLSAQENTPPSMLLGAIFNPSRAAVHYSMFGPREAGYFQFYFGAEFAEHELRGSLAREAPVLWSTAGHFPLRTYHAGFLYSQIIEDRATVGMGVQYRDYHEFTEYTIPGSPASYVHKAEWYGQKFDMVFSAGWIFRSWLYASLTYTTRGEFMLGASVAIKH